MSAPEAYWSDGQVTLYHGKAEEVLPSLAADSIDSIVCDPPYGLEFMGKEWDSFRTGDGFRRSRNPADADRDSVFGRTSRTSPEYRTGSESWRTGAGMSKPGLGPRPTEWPAFGGSDSANATCATCGGRMRGARKCACAEPDWRVKGKALDKDEGRAQLHAYQAWCEQWARECLRVLKPGGFMLAFGGTRTWHRLSCGIEDAGFEIRDNVADLTGIDGPALMWIYSQGFPKSRDVLKPAWEPIIVARKPLIGTVAQNVAKYGTGALNIETCRVEPTGESRPRNGEASQEARYADSGGTDFAALPGVRGGDPDGRWPPNLVLGAEAAAELDRQSGVLTSGANPTRRNSDVFSRDVYGDFQGQRECTPRRGADSGGASRFFPVFRYQAKAGSDERPKDDDGSGHPTVKPLELVRWEVRLLTPPGGTVLDLFAGSGTTGEACVIEGFPCILIDKDPKAIRLIRKRLDKPIQPVLFGGGAA